MKLDALAHTEPDVAIAIGIKTGDAHRRIDSLRHKSVVLVFAKSQSKPRLRRGPGAAIDTDPASEITGATGADAVNLFNVFTQGGD
ncbi:MAG: hypothetical protein AB3X44_08875 [Leptothrix sp. (in: b-proteobacteria)]